MKGYAWVLIGMAIHVNEIFMLALLYYSVSFIELLLIIIVFDN